jgi:O-antigen/teichoic acid export membrane protein
VVGPIGVTYFEVSAKVARALKGIHNQATHVLFPVASQLAVSSTGLNDFSASYLNFSKYVALLSAPFFAGLTFFGGDVLELWVGPDIAAHSTAVLSVLVLAYFANSFTNITNHFALGEDQYRYVVVYGSTLLFAVVASIYPLVVSFGVVGAAGSVFASRFVAALLFLGLYNRRCNIRTRTYFIEVVLLATGVSFGTAGLAYGIGAMLGAGAVVALAIAIVCMIGYFVVVWRYASIPPTLREKLVRLVSNQARAVGTGSDSS